MGIVETTQSCQKVNEEKREELDCCRVQEKEYQKDKCMMMMMMNTTKL